MFLSLIKRNKVTKKIDQMILNLIAFVITSPFKLMFFMVKSLFSLVFGLKGKKHNLDEIYRIHKKNPRAAGYAFEKFTLNLFQDIGYKGDLAMNVKKTGKYPAQFSKTKGDGGIDIIVHNDKEIILVQTKFYSKNIDKNIVAETMIALQIFQDHFSKMGDKRKVVAYVVTNVDYDNTAYAYAEHSKVNLINGRKLSNMIRKAA